MMRLFKISLGTLLLLTVSVPLQALPILPLQFTPAAVQFGIVTLENTQGPFSATFQLRDPASPFGPIRLQLSDPNHFQIVSDSCSGVTLTDADTCEVSLSFTPNTFGHYSSFLVVLDESDGLGNFIPLEGTGAESGFTGAPGPVALNTTVSTSTDEMLFETQAPGVISNPQALTLTNTGGELLRVEATTFGGDAPYNFARIDACMPQLVAPGGTCAITSFFTPISPDPATAALAITANVGQGPLIATLSGNNAAPAPSGGACTLGAPASATSDLGAWTGLYSLLVLTWIRRLK